MPPHVQETKKCLNRMKVDKMVDLKQFLAVLLLYMTNYTSNITRFRRRVRPVSSGILGSVASAVS